MNIFDTIRGFAMNWNGIANIPAAVKALVNAKVSPGQSVVVESADSNGMITGLKSIPIKTKLSEFSNDTNFVSATTTALVNYYTKAQTEELIAQIPTFQVLVVQQLPTTGAEKTLYLVPFASEGGNYAEYLWANGAWELLGTPHVDLTGYATEEWVQEMFAGKTGAYLPMPKAYNVGAWLFAEEVDGKGNVSKTGTKVLDWVATHNTIMDPSGSVLVPEVTMEAGISKAFNYDTIAGQEELAVLCDGRLYLCTPKFGSDDNGDYVEYWFNLGNASLRSSTATNTGEPFFFFGYSGASSPIMAYFSTAGEHTIEIYGGTEKSVYNKLPSEFLPEGFDPNGLTMIDQATGNKVRIVVRNGALSVEEAGA